MVISNAMVEPNKNVEILSKSKFESNIHQSLELNIISGKYNITIYSGGSGGAGGSNGMIESESGESGGLSQVGNFIIDSPSPGLGSYHDIGENAYGCSSDTIIKYSNEGLENENIKGGTAAFCSKEIYNTELSGNIEIVIGAGGKGGAGYIGGNSTLTAGGNGEDGYVLIEPI